MGAVTFDKLYDNYNTLSDAKDKVAEHSKEYLEAIEGTKGDEREKKLAAQIISKFFKHFPSLQCQAIEAVFDICEDDETSIRIAAMKTLPAFCKDNKEYMSKIADILAQLLQLEDQQEYNVASSSLLQVLREDPAAVVKCILKHIYDGDSVVRDKCIKFLVTKIKSLDKSIITSDVEDVIIGEIKKVLTEATAEEYVLLMPYLISTKIASTLSGQQELVAIAAEQAELDQDFDLLDKESNNADRLITSVKYVLPFFSSKLESTRFVKYICDQVLPQWDNFNQVPHGSTYQLAILRQLAELSTYCGKLEHPSLHVVQIFDKLKVYMPPPPEDTSVVTMPHLEFSCVEALLYAFHRLARQCTDFLTHDPAVLKDFRARLMYFSRGVQGCTRALNNIDKDKTFTAEEIRVQQVSPKLLGNINTLIKDLFYQPPMYKCNISLSFKTDDSSTVKKSPEVNSSAKRHIPITFDSNGSGPGAPKQGRNTRSGDSVKIYTPPSGKFSNNFQSYDNDRKSSGTRFRGRGGRNIRGWNSNRGWRN